MPINFEALCKTSQVGGIKTKRVKTLEHLMPQKMGPLYPSQRKILQQWFKRRREPETIVKIHTGGGKTLVGLLMGHASRMEHGEPVLYLVPTTQLVEQTMEEAKRFGIPAVAYERGRALGQRFVNSQAVLVATYKALFHGRSKFGVRATSSGWQHVGTIIMDDAHSAKSILRDSFTMSISCEHSIYQDLLEMWRPCFEASGSIGTFKDLVAGRERGPLEVPYWEWNKHQHQLRHMLEPILDEWPLTWPLLRDHLHLCHGLLTPKAFTITPVLPLIDMFPSFTHASHKIYMSATLGDDADLIRTFNLSPRALSTPLLLPHTEETVGAKLILAPEASGDADEGELLQKIEQLLLEAAYHRLGAMILTPSYRQAERWGHVAYVAQSSEEVDLFMGAMVEGSMDLPLVLANRYDGINLAGDACRLLVIDGLPQGASDYETFRAKALPGTLGLTRDIAQRLEQGMGRGARGKEDHCIVVLCGRELADWVGKTPHIKMLTDATQAQLGLGLEASQSLDGSEDFLTTVRQLLFHPEEWVPYHHACLEKHQVQAPLLEAASWASLERQAVDLWAHHRHEDALDVLENMLAPSHRDNRVMWGYMKQLAAKIAEHWGRRLDATQLQHQAYLHNPNLHPPPLSSAHRGTFVLGQGGPQEDALVALIQRKGHKLMEELDEIASELTAHASANRFEQALMKLGTLLGLGAKRFDHHGEGPDLVWFLPNQVGLILEVKSKKKADNPLTKEQHGQLLVAQRWFRTHYPEWTPKLACVHPNQRATVAASASDTLVLTLDALAILVGDLRRLFSLLTQSQEELPPRCNKALQQSNLSAHRLLKHYFVPFETQG